MKRTAAQKKQRQPRPTSASPLRALTDEILGQEEILRQGGGPAGHERQRKLNRLPVRERLSLLLDPNSSFLELGLWWAHDLYPEVGPVPAAGVVTGIGAIEGRSAMVIANDATVKAGAFFPATCKKVLRAQKIAARCNLPLIYLVDSSGVFLPMQDEIFPDEDDFGRIFRNNAVLSAMGVPQYAAIMGNCVAGGAYLPVLCDKILMTEGSALYLAGPALVKAAIGQDVDAEDLGGALMHSRVSGTIDFREKDDVACLQRLRSLVALLPPYPEPEALAPGREGPGANASGSGSELFTLPPDYDAHTLLSPILDPNSLQEYKADYGQTLLCAYAAIAGHKVGVVASQRLRCKSATGELQIGGVLYADSADKAARFIMDCDQTRLPLIFFQDVQGFMVGRDAEHSGIIRSGAKLVNAVSNCTTPKITVIVGGSFGAGNYALCGKAFDPTFIFAWPSAKYAVMGADQAAGTLLTLAKRGGATATSPQELKQLQEKITADYQSKTDIRYAAARGWVDAIIPPDATREILIQSLRCVTRPPPPGGFRGGVMQV
jgi:acetyl-CoA carboxylase carboxyltransferase component